MIQLAFLLALLALVLLVQAASHTEPELPAPDLPPLPPSLRYYLFTEQCYQTLFVQGDLLNVECFKRAIVKLMGYGIILGGAIVKVPQILKVVNKKTTFGLSYASVFLEVSTQLFAVAYNVYRSNPFSVYGETLFIAIQCAVILSLFIVYGEASRRTFYSLALLPVAGMFYAAINPAYFPDYIIDHAMIAQIVLFSGARLLQIIEIHRVKSTGSLSAITCSMNVLGNLSRLATALVEVADDLLFRASFIVALLMNGYILLCFFIFRTKSKPEEKKQ